MWKKFVFLDFSANISYRSSIVRYDFWCFAFDEIDEQVNIAIFVHLNVDFDVKIEKRDDFDATTEREIISIQNIHFLDVATDAISDCFDVIDDVNENENFVIDSERLIDDLNIETDSFDENVANDVDIAIIAFENSIDSTDDCFTVKKKVDIAIIAFENSIDSTDNCFDVKKKINIAIIAFDVDFAYSLDVIIAIIASIAFDENVTIFLADFVCCCNFVLCFLIRKAFNFSCFCESNFWYSILHRISNFCVK